MAFNLAGSVITQSGTDTSLIGLSGIAGVVTNTYGNGDSIYRTYIITNLGIDVTGALTIDPIKEMLVFNSNTVEPAIDVLSGGTLNVGLDFNINGFITETKGIAINFGDEDQGGGGNGQALVVRAGGHINHRGATIRIADSIIWEDGSQVTIKNGFISVPETNNFRIRSSVSTLADIDGLEVVSDKFAELDVFRNFANFKGYFPQGAVTQFVSALSAGTNDPFIVRDLNTAGISAAPKGDLSIWRGAEVRIINPEKETPITASMDSKTNGLVQMFKEFNLTVSDTNAVAIENAKYFITDIDNGGRFNQIPQNGNNYDLLTNRTYTGFSDAFGVFPTQTVLTGTVGDGTGINTVRPWNYRSKSNDWSSIFDIALISYNHQISVPEQSLTGAGSLDWSWILLDDTLITEADKTTAAAYTTQETALKAYDQLKSILFDNYAGETETIATRLGDTLDARALDVVIKNETGSATLVGNTLILNASTWVNQGLVTTGTITIEDGIDITGSTFSSLNLTSAKDLTDVKVTGELSFNDDSDGAFFFSGCEIGVLRNDGNGALDFQLINSSVGDSSDSQINLIDSFFSFEGITSYEAYSDAGFTTLIGSGLSSEILAFTFNSGTTFYFKLNVNGENIDKIVTPTQAGEFIVDISQSGLLIGLQAQVNQIPAAVWSDSNDYAASEKGGRLKRVDANTQNY